MCRHCRQHVTLTCGQRVVHGQRMAQAANDIFLSWQRSEDLARAHARSGDRLAIAGYFGAGRGFDRRSLASRRCTPIRTSATIGDWPTWSARAKSPPSWAYDLVARVGHRARGVGQRTCGPVHRPELSARAGKVAASPSRRARSPWSRLRAPRARGSPRRVLSVDRATARDRGRGRTTPSFRRRTGRCPTRLRSLALCAARGPTGPRAGATGPRAGHRDRRRVPRCGPGRASRIVISKSVCACWTQLVASSETISSAASTSSLD